jgi:hypothetical protein
VVGRVVGNVEGVTVGSVVGVTDGICLRGREKAITVIESRYTEDELSTVHRNLDRTVGVLTYSCGRNGW